MSDPKISVGIDTPTGEPGNGPTGPYITDEDDGTGTVPPSRPPTPDGASAADPSGARHPSPDVPAPSGKAPSRTETEITRRSDFGSDRAGGD